MIKIITTQEIDDKQQWIFMTISIGDKSVKYTHVAPSSLTGQALQKFVDSRENNYVLDMLKDAYPNSDYRRFMKGDLTELDIMKKWIKSGHKNLIGKRDGKNVYEVIERQEWTYEHPDFIELEKEIDEIKDEKVRGILKKLARRER